jgi:16S rRNA (uracil1498-N3)-methyltransferase
MLSPTLVGTTIALPDEVAHHVVRVLRLDSGAPVTLFDGTGGEYLATLVEAGRRRATAQLERFDAVERESPLEVTLVQAVLAADAMDYAIRKAVELGVSAVTPVVATRSQFSLAGERGEKRLAHWRGIAIAACEQCGRNRIPPVASPQPLEAWLATVNPERPSVIASPGATASLAAFAARTPPRSIVIGPEGGFTDAELSLAVDKRIVLVHLGPRVLRAETAGVAALAILAAVAGDAR